MSRYILSKKAEDDLTDIYSYSYLNYGEQQADCYTDSLKQTCQFLADYPFINRERSEFIPPIRIHHHQKHLIVYRLESVQVVIIRFLHERMNTQQNLQHQDS